MQSAVGDTNGKAHRGIEIVIDIGELRARRRLGRPPGHADGDDECGGDEQGRVELRPVRDFVVAGDFNRSF